MSFILFADQIRLSNLTHFICFFPVFDRIGFRKRLRPQWLSGIASDSRARGPLITVHTFSLCNPTSLKAEDQTVEVDSCYPFLPVFDLIKFSKSQGLR